MKLTPELRRKMRKAVVFSMQIEGYSCETSPERKKHIKHLMKLYNIKVNIDKAVFIAQSEKNHE